MQDRQITEDEHVLQGDTHDIQLINVVFTELINNTTDDAQDVLLQTGMHVEEDKYLLAVDELHDVQLLLVFEQDRQGDAHTAHILPLI